MNNLPRVEKFMVKTQFLIRTCEGTYFKSYQTLVAFLSNDGKVTLDERAWDYSFTTGKYRNKFLGETKAETLEKIKSGEYRLANLNE